MLRIDKSSRCPSTKIFMRTNAIAVIMLAFLSIIPAAGVFAAGSQFFQYRGHDYYVVDGNDNTMDTGNKVCDEAGKKCDGYTDFDTEACQYFHPYASVTQSMSGSKSGFYCNGGPQDGLACANSANNCQVCPTCNVNADCDTRIGDQYGEMYVDCGLSQPVSLEIPALRIPLQNTTGLWSQFVDFINKIFSWISSRLPNVWNSISSFFAEKQIPQQIQDIINGNSLNISIPPDSQACEFVQTNVHLVTCGAYGAADNFCAITMQSPDARSLSCQDNGAIVCDVPCKTTPAHQPIKTCPFDNDRMRGNQAPPLGLCN